MRLTQFEFNKSNSLDITPSKEVDVVKSQSAPETPVHKHKISDVVPLRNTTEFPNINWQTSLIYKTKFEQRFDHFQTDLDIFRCKHSPSRSKDVYVARKIEVPPIISNYH